jgi:hypothetical protein
LLGGDFRCTANATFYYGFVRLNANGSFDNTMTGFTGLQTSYTTDGVKEILVEADGKIILGGAFIKVNGQSITHFARLNANGSLDNSFNATNSYTDEVVKFSKRSTDGKFIIAQKPYGGSGITPRVSLGNANGTRDDNFNINSKLNGTYVYTGIFTSEGILVGGDFTQFEGQPASKLLKVSETGVRVPSFALSESITGSAVNELLPLSSGFILVGTTAAGLDLVSQNGNLLAEDFQIEGTVLKIKSTPSYLYLMGTISSAGGLTRTSLVRLSNPLAPQASPSSLVAQTQSSPRQNSLTWTDNSSTEAAFEIQRSLTTNTNFVKIGTAGANTTVYVDSENLTGGTQYFYRVKAVNINGETPYSNEATITTLPDPPSPPSNLVLSLASSSEINLSWQDNSSNETNFEIYKSSPTNSTFTLLNTAGANVKTFKDVNLVPGTPYFYKVRAINAGGASDFTDEVSQIITGIEELSETIKIYPNPVTVTFTMENASSETIQIMCYNALGESLKIQTISASSSIDVNTETWAEGIYFIKVISLNHTNTVKLVKR